MKLQLLLLSLTCSTTIAYKILLVCPAPVMSHHILCRAASDILSEAGHDVTLISAYPKEQSTFREIGVNMRKFKEQLPSGLQFGNSSRSGIYKRLITWIPLLSDLVMSNENVQKVLDEKFDAFILEFYLDQNLLGIGAKLNCPSIILTSLSILQWVAVATRNPLAVEMVPNMMTPFSAKMDIWERMSNIHVTAEFAVFEYFTEHCHREAYERHFPEQAKKISYDDLKYRISSVLINCHPSVGVVRPLLPNAVEIGGYHVSNPEPLPDDLQTTMDNAENGVIYFSLGSVAEGREIDEKYKEIILKAFSGLKQTILWKFEDNINNLPSNVIIRKWFPQNSILSHPNLRLFISHGGLLSRTEAIHFNVPMLIIPLFSDQYHNAKVYSDRGQALTLFYSNITEVSFNWALNEMLINPKYKENTERYHRIYHDRPLSPKDLLVYQVEHVIRTNGAEHLTPPPLSRQSQLLLDIIAVVLIPLHIIIFLTIYACKKCCKCKRNEKLKKS